MKPSMKAWVIILERHLRGKEERRVLNVLSPRTSPEFIKRHLQALSSMLFLNGEEQCDDAKGGHRFVVFNTSEHDITLDASNFILRAQRSDVLQIEADQDAGCYRLRWKGKPYVPRSGGQRFEPPEMCARLARLQINGVLPISTFPPPE
jgi:hypothetical protein